MRVWQAILRSYPQACADLAHSPDMARRSSCRQGREQEHDEGEDGDEEELGHGSGPNEDQPMHHPSLRWSGFELLVNDFPSGAWSWQSSDA